MEKTLTINPFLHIEKVTVKWTYDEDCDDIAADETAYGCRVRADLLLELVDIPRNYTIFDIETSLWGIIDPSKEDRKQTEDDLIFQLRQLLELRLGVDCSKFDERFKIDHFGKPVQKPKGSAF